MLRRVIAATKRALGLQPPGRTLAVFPDDTFLVSYPKSGNTWARFLIANLINPQATVDFSNVNKLIPGIDVTRHRDMLRIRRPRIVKSHQYFDPRYPRVIYIVRDPRDVSLSEYHAKRKRKRISDDYPIGDFIHHFLAGETCDYGSWGEHVASWLSTRYGQPGFLLLRYEDMLQDTERELSRVATFVGLNSTPELIRQAVRSSSVEKMRNLEKSQAQLFNATKDTRQDILFVRDAQAGGWHSALPESSVLQVEQAWGHMIRWLGYEITLAEKASLSKPPFPLSAVERPAR